MTKILAFDTETFYDKDTTVKTMGTHKYAHDPRRQPTYQGNVIWFNGANELRMDNRSA